MKQSEVHRTFFGIILIAAVVGAMVPGFAFAVEPLVVGEGAEKYSLGLHLEYLEDEEGKLTFADILEPEMAMKFLPSQVETPNFGYTTSVYWFSFELQNPSSNPLNRLFEIGYPLLDNIDVYLVSQTREPVHHHLGDSLPFSERPVDHRNFVIPIEIQGHEMLRVLFRVQTGGNIRVPLKLWKPQKFFERDATNVTILGLYFGLALVMALYNLFVFFSLKERTYLYYVLFVITFVGVQASLGGLSYQYLWPDSLWWAEKNISFFIAISLMFACLFANNFLGLAEHAKRHWSTLHFLGWVSAGLALLSMFFLEYSVAVRLLMLLILLLVPVALSAGVVRWRQGSMEARYYVVAWMSLLLGCGAFVLVQFGVLPANAVTTRGQQVGSALEVILLSLGLARKLKTLTDENLRIQVGAAEELQGKVDIATSEIRQQKEEADLLRTKAEEYSAELVVLDQQKTAFFQNISHELRTPLTLILNPLESLAEKLPGDIEVDVAAKNSRRLLRLVNQLLDFQKLEAGRHELKLSHTNLVRFIQICADYFASACSSKEIVFKLTVNSEEVNKSTFNQHIIMVNGDIDALEKVVFNFLSNALKYTPNGGVIELGLNEANDKARIFIKDSGPGISGEGKKKLFHVFSQVEDSTTREHEGTGLGLALAKSLVEKMGGEVGADSEVGKGSTFWAEFPTVPSFELLPVRDLLIVEDDLNVRSALEIALEELGSIEVCEDAESARRVLDEYRFRIVVSDIRLPGEDGVSLLDHVRESQVDCYRILITGQADPYVLQKAVNEAQAHKIFYKPLSVRNMLAPLLTQYLSESPIIAKDDTFDAKVEFEVRDWLLADGGQEAGSDTDTGPFQSLDELAEDTGEVILIVEDRINMRDLIGNSLMKESYRLVSAPDGKRGLEIARQIKPNLIITDWMMPRMSGPDLVKEIRDDAELKGIPIILMTAKTDEESKLIGIEIGADLFLGKPFNNRELLSSVRNLLQLKAGERDAQELSAYLSRVLGALTEGVIILDAEHRITSVNSVFSSLVGYSVEELNGTSFGDVLAGGELIKVAGIGSLLADGAFESVNMSFAELGGMRVTLKVSGSRIVDEKGTLLGSVIVARDERELLRLQALESRAAAEEREQAATLAKLHEELKETSDREIRHTKNLLVQAEKLSQLGQMVASIGHEISNPIMVVSMSTESQEELVNGLEHDFMPIFSGSEEAKDFGVKFDDYLKSLRKIGEATTLGANRLMDLSSALRTQSRMEQEATPAVAINEVVEESMVLVGGRIKRHSLEKSLGELPRITCYRSKIGQVVTNLLANAGDALMEKVERSKENGGERFSGQISVISEISERDGKPGIVVIVSDNGDGVPEAIRDQIFEQFFTTKAAGVGTGLGLSMCAEIVKEHGGMLSITNDKNLGGACFELWLPVEGPPTS